MEQQVEKITPYGRDSGDKTSQVRSMFDSIAPAYDFMNRAMTFGIDKLWRRKAVGMVERHYPASILDIATGTGDLAIAMARRIQRASVAGIDLSPNMLDIAARKINKEQLDGRVTLACADGTNLPFPSSTFDVVTVAYGIRNFDNMLKGYREMFRVLNDNGMLVVVELSTPVNPLALKMYNVYAKGLIPMVGRIVSRNKRAYTYLPESIAAVPQRHLMVKLLQEAGFTDCEFHELTFGTCIIYTAYKNYVTSMRNSWTS